MAFGNNADFLITFPRDCAVLLVSSCFDFKFVKGLEQAKKKELKKRKESEKQKNCDVRKHIHLRQCRKKVKVQDQLNSRHSHLYIAQELQFNAFL